MILIPWMDSAATVDQLENSRFGTLEKIFLNTHKYREDLVARTVGWGSCILPFASHSPVFDT